MKKAIALTICLIFLVVTNNFAEPQKKHSWILGTETFYVIKRQGESTRPDGGMMYGLMSSYAYHGELPLFSPEMNKWMLKVEADASWGEIDYGRGSVSKERILEFRELVGYNFSTLKETTITPYIGAGYRHLTSDWSNASSIYEFDYFYIPIGIERVVALDKGWSIGTKLEYDYFWWGKHKYKDEDNTFTLKQNKGYGLRGSVEFQKKGKKVDFTIEPFIRYWNIKKSEDVIIASSSRVLNRTLNSIHINTFCYPKHSSEEIGIKFAVRF